MLFSGGPCTVGPGLVVGVELKEMIRSHSDFHKDRAQHFKKARKYYDSLAQRAAKNGHTVDILAGCLDQVGLYEMKPLVGLTNGFMILSDSFQTTVFKKSFQRIFNKDEDDVLVMGLNATLEILTTKEFNVCGLIGNGISLQKKHSCVSETEIGIGGTNSWKFCALSPTTTAALYFEVCQQPASNGANTSMQQGSRGLIQFITHYQHGSGFHKLRVTTVARNWVDASSPDVQYSFDEEAAAVAMARIAVFKSNADEDGADVLRWLDRMLIKLCQKFGEYRKDDPTSFQLPPGFTYYPQFMFHLRRSQFLQVFNNSPDETAFYQ
jgi:protein transport protein SEC23